MWRVKKSIKQKKKKTKKKKKKKKQKKKKNKKKKKKTLAGLEPCSFHLEGQRTALR